MKKHRYRGLLSLVLAAFILCLSPVSVYASGYSDHTEVAKKVRIGAVDIELHQKFPETVTMVVPGQVVSLESSVENRGKAAWIRVKLEYPAGQAAEGGILKTIDDEFVQFADDGWKKIGDYHYYTKPVESGKTIPFTSSITFPTDWDNRQADMKMGVSFTAEGIQEKNFTPDFNSDDPWHGAVIEAFDGDEYREISEDYKQFSVQYKNGVEGLLHLEDSFFNYKDDLMPGDKLTGEATITNRMNIPVKVFFEMKNEGDSELLKDLELSIKNGEDTVYEGPLSGSISPAKLLLQYEPDRSTKFSYQLSVPDDVGNTHALTDFHVNWIFSAEEVIPEESPVEEIKETVIQTVERVTETVREVIKTGEFNMLYPVGMLAGILCMIGAILTVVKKKRQRKGGSDDA